MIRKSIIIVLIACLMPSIAAARGPTTAQRQARVHYRQGANYFAAGLYDKAREEYEAAYQLVPLPQALFNVAQCQRMEGKLQAALDAYTRYLAEESEGEVATTAKAHVASISAILERENKTKVEEDEKRQRAIEAAKAAALQQETMGIEPTPRAAREDRSGEPTPLYKKWWLWTAVGGVVVVGLAVGLGVGLTRGHDQGFSSTLPTFGSTQMAAPATFRF